VTVVNGLSLQAVDERIERLRTVIDVTTGRLVELDADVTRKLLESSDCLRGETAAVWADASDRNAALWQDQFALDGALTRIIEIRGTRRWVPQRTLQQLCRLLDGPSVASRCSAIHEHLWSSGPGPDVRVTFDDALSRMKADYELVTGVVAQVAVVWGAVTDRLVELADSVAGLENRLDGAGGVLPNELRSTSEAVAVARCTAREDPLGLPAGALEELAARVSRLEGSADELARERQAWLCDLAAAEGLIRDGLEAVTACRIELGHVAEKVVVPAAVGAELDELGARLEGYREECGRLQRLGATAQAPVLRRRAHDATARVLLLAGGALDRLARRDQLRGILEACLAKAQKVGLGEDIAVDATYAAAHDALYVAPCDVDAAEKLVETFRHMLRPLRERRP